MHQIQKHLDKIPAEFGAGMEQIDIDPLDVGKSFFLLVAKLGQSVRIIQMSQRTLEFMNLI